MSNLIKRGRYWHYRFVHRGDAFSGSTKCESHRDAKAWLANFRARLALGEVGAAPCPLLSRAYEHWMETHAGRVSQAHRDRMESSWRIHLIPLVGNLRGDQVTVEVVETIRRNYLDKATKRKHASAPRTQAGANTLLGYLKAVLNHLVAMGHMRSLPCEIRLVRAQQRVRAFVPAAKIPQFLAAVDSTYNLHASVAVRAMLYLGLRESEAYGMRWEWFGAGLKSYTPGLTKGREALQLPVPTPLRPWIWAAAWDGLPPEPLRLGLVIPAEDGKMHRASFTRAAIRRGAVAIKVPGITAHRLRGTCATLMARAGVPVSTIQRALRHRDIRTTLRYVEVGVQDLQEAQARTWGAQK